MAVNKIIHSKCINNIYPFSNIQRLFVSDENIPWSALMKDYNPPEYNSPSLKNKPWADLDLGNNRTINTYLFIDKHFILDDPKFKPNWNALDGTINRTSYTGHYVISNKRPINPVGRTGITGRGLLGKWGPNHAADPIVTRWKRQDGKQVLNDSTKL